MPKPLRSEIRNPPNRQFAHFGVLDTGGQNKTAFFGSIVFNVVLALLAIIIGASVKKTIDTRKKMELSYAEIKPIPKPEPPKPKIIPPKPPPPKIEPPKIEPPKIVHPEVKPLDVPKPVPVVMPKPTPPMVAAPPKPVIAAAAPKPTTINLGQSAAVVNHNTAPPAPVALGLQNSPVPSNLKGPAVSNVRLNNGMSGMPAGNTGVGRPTNVNLAGSGQPNGSLSGGGVAKVEGVKGLGCTGCTGTNGNATATRPQQVALGAPPPPPPPAARTVTALAGHGPVVISKPKPVYTPEATAAHIEGSVVVNIKVSAAGVVTVVGIAKGLGHGLDESARQCAAAIRFKPATDSAGNPVEWEGPVTITFQMA
jgi:TonB family protein